MGREGNVAWIGTKGNAYRTWVGNSKEDLDVSRRIILK
jgi:hypothetical protein